MQIWIYFILINNWHIDIPWNIAKIFYWISFFFLFNTWFRYWIVWYFVWYIMQSVHIANWCTWLAHPLCKSLIWNYKDCWAQPWLSFGILQALWWSWSWMYRVIFFWLIQDFVLKFWNMHYFSLFSFGWWYTSVNNKHQISLYLGLKKMANILQITFSNGFSFKKITICLFVSLSLSLCLSVSVFLSVSVCLSACLPLCLSVSLSVPFTHFSLCSYHGIIMKLSGVITKDRSDVYAKVQGQNSKVKVTEVKIQISHFRTITLVWFHIWWWNDAQSLILFRSGARLILKVICQISKSQG